ncbi:hypothetical protein BH789_gp056 [Gordonia phage GMA6]|uniref:Uncharacterized protein n=1 Tax=Gordonia phage GMA6 TaxID=1647285 RepID=A0A0K0NLA6_9CAUD|nr:hypothetical protein BH789_gp056 [Gordonia phage GMA6]AKL88337.1 hypothetical protein GMA6_56 [Gordonia phage GMA6]
MMSRADFVNVASVLNKEKLSVKAVTAIANELDRIYPAFDRERFLEQAINPECSLPIKKQRSTKVSGTKNA